MTSGYIVSGRRNRIGPAHADNDEEPADDVDKPLGHGKHCFRPVPLLNVPDGQS